MGFTKELARDFTSVTRVGQITFAEVAAQAMGESVRDAVPITQKLLDIAYKKYGEALPSACYGISTV